MAYQEVCITVPVFLDCYCEVSCMRSAFKASLKTGYLHIDLFWIVFSCTPRHFST